MIKKTILLLLAFFLGFWYTNAIWWLSVIPQWATEQIAKDAWKNDPGNMQSESFQFNVGDLSPSTKKYTSGWENVKNLLNSITVLLMVILPTISVLLMVAGGIMIIVSGWASEKVTKWKNIIVYNIVAIVIALLSYSIIRLVIWLLWSTAFS